MAQESRDFDEFKASVERFFYESDEDSEDERLWEEALKSIRAANCTPPELFAKLPREAAESKPSQITVERLNRADARFRPSDNITDTYSVPMAHAAQMSASFAFDDVIKMLEKCAAGYTIRLANHS